MNDLIILWEQSVALAGNGWCYEQVCLAEMFKLPKMLLASLLIACVMCRFFIHEFNLEI